MIEIEREDLETLVELAFENWEMAESEWSHFPDDQDIAFLLRMADLSGNGDHIAYAKSMYQSAVKSAEDDVVVLKSCAKAAGQDYEDQTLKISQSITAAQEYLGKLKAITSHTPSAADPAGL